MTVRRYSAGIQRAKGLLELAAALYESSLSSESWKAAEGVLQTESRVGRALTLSLIGKPNDRRETSLSFVTGGVREIEAVADGKFSLAWVNPSVLLTMAYRGKGPFRKKLPLRALAVFPSYDVMGFAVHESTGITSLSQIKKERIPLRLSTRVVTKSALREDSTMFTVAAVMEAAGFTFAELRKWGGEIHLVSRPSDPVRRESIEKSTVNAIFDEGIKSWARTALENGFRFLPIENGVLRRMVALGYRPTAMTQSRFAGMAEDVTTVDFSGWPMIVRADMPDDVAYALCESIERRKEAIPTDNYEPLDMARLCANDEETPCDVPLHRGAQLFYEQRGYLR